MPDTTSPAPLPAPNSNASATPSAPAPNTPEAPAAASAPVLTIAPKEAPAPESGAQPRSPSALHLAQIQELDEAEQICLVAQKPAYAPELAKKKISPIIVVALLTAILAARRKSNVAVVCTSSTTSATVDVDETEETFLRTLRQAQAAAKQEFAFTDPERLGPYFVGERIDQSRARLEQCGQGIIDQSTAERPGGADTAFIERATDEFEKWKAAKAQPASRRSQAKTERAARNAMVKAIQQGRMQLQLAADQAWPPGVPAHAGVRGEFHLQPNRPFMVPV